VEYKLSRLPIAKRLNRVIYSPYFLIAIAAVALLSNVLEMELLMYVFACVLMLYAGILGTDFRLMVPLFVFCYITPSVGNNPGMNETTVFSAGSGGVLILVMAGLVVLCFAARCTLGETQRVLMLQGLSPLYPRLARDAALIVALNRRIYEIGDVNAYLAQHGLEELAPCGEP
jgi:hypothetical protein